MRACATSWRCAAIRPRASGTPTGRIPEGYASTAELVAGIKRIGDFKVSVSAYPEKHPEAASLDADIDALKAKVDAGADQAITQFFFENEIYLRYLEKVRAAGITIPIIPGILPVQNFKQAANFARRTGASVPYWLAARFEGLEDDVETRRLVAAAVAAEQVLDLVDEGVNDFHFYSMNRSDLVYAICHLLGLRAQAPKLAAAKARLIPPAPVRARKGTIMAEPQDLIVRSSGESGDANDSLTSVRSSKPSMTSQDGGSTTRRNGDVLGRYAAAGSRGGSARSRRLAAPEKAADPAQPRLSVAWFASLRSQRRACPSRLPGHARETEDPTLHLIGRCRASGLEGGLQGSPRLLEASFEASASLRHLRMR